MLVISGICLLSLGGLELVQRLVPADSRQQHNDVAGFIYAALGVIYAVLMALVVIAVWEEYGAASDTVEQEANAAADIFWLADQLPEPRASDAPTGRPADAAGTKERLFAHPDRPASYSAGGKRQLEELGEPLESFDGYFTEALALDPHNYLLKPLRRGSNVIAGTILGRIDKTDARLAPHVEFAIRPAGRGAPQIDPKPILDGWKLLESTAIYRANGKNAFAAANAEGPSIGQIMLMSKEQLQRAVLADRRLEIYGCGRRDVAVGAIDRRVLATLAFLVGERPQADRDLAECGHGYYTASGNVSEHSSGNAVDIAAVNDIPIAGNQGDGSITDITIRRLLTLQGSMKPHQIISLMTYPGADNTLAMADHADHIHVGFQPVGDLLGGRQAAGDPQAGAMDEAGRAARLDREPGRPAPRLEVRDQGRPPRRLTAPPPQRRAARSASSSSSCRGRSARRTDATSCVRRRMRHPPTCSCSRRWGRRSGDGCATAAESGRASAAPHARDDGARDRRRR